MWRVAWRDVGVCCVASCATSHTPRRCCAHAAELPPVAGARVHVNRLGSSAARLMRAFRCYAHSRARRCLRPSLPLVSAIGPSMRRSRPGGVCLLPAFLGASRRAGSPPALATPAGRAGGSASHCSLSVRWRVRRGRGGRAAALLARCGGCRCPCRYTPASKMRARPHAGRYWGFSGPVLGPAFAGRNRRGAFVWFCFFASNSGCQIQVFCAYCRQARQPAACAFRRISR